MSSCINLMRKFDVPESRIARGYLGLGLGHLAIDFLLLLPTLAVVVRRLAPGGILVRRLVALCLSFVDADAPDALDACDAGERRVRNAPLRDLAR